MQPPPVIDATHLAPTNTFSRQLGFWSIHCGLTSLPSFCIALTQFNSAAAILAMLCGIATFILGYSFLTSRSFYGKIHIGLMGRSIKLGARIRMIVSLASLPLLIPIIDWNAKSGDPPESLMFVPDFWFGFIAMIIVNILYSLTGTNVFARGMNNPGDLSFLPTYLITMTEGILISISLVFIAFITLIILNFRKNRRQLPSQHFPQA